MNEKIEIKQYIPLILSAGLGALLGAGAIVGLSVTITVWQAGMGLTAGQVGILSGGLTFAIAAGSLVAGNITKKFGLIPSFNYINVLYVTGALICVFTTGFEMLLCGLILIGFASGADLPISLTVVSGDAPDEKTSARLIAIVQVFWQSGAFACSIIGFLVSRTEGTFGGRVVLGTLGCIAALAFVLRTFWGKVKDLHIAGEKYRAAEGTRQTKEISFTKLFAGEGKNKYLAFFFLITIYYCCWNLLSNTFGQFQTYIFVKANATQFFATGIGLVLTVVGLIGGMLFTLVAGSGARNKFFYIGIFVQAAAMVGIAMGGGSLVLMTLMIACYDMGTPFAGETMYKVWTQESFPVETRTSVQGFINGFSRFLCGVFALITPMLVTAERIQMTMFGFAGIIMISALTGSMVIRLQKKYGIGQM